MLLALVVVLCVDITGGPDPVEFNRRSNFSSLNHNLYDNHFTIPQFHIDEKFIVVVVETTDGGFKVPECSAAVT